MLPLHGQGTAAVDNNTGQGVPVIGAATGNVFVKQSEQGVAEFLIYI